MAPPAAPGGAISVSTLLYWTNLKKPKRIDETPTQGIGFVVDKIGKTNHPYPSLYSFRVKNDLTNIILHQKLKRKLSLAKQAVIDVTA